jgi:hypothetical protein
MKTLTIYLASDGTRFESQSECKIYESISAFSLALGLKPSDIAAALNGQNRPLANTLESLGIKIARARCARGEARRKRVSRSAKVEKDNEGGE